MRYCARMLNAIRPKQLSAVLACALAIGAVGCSDDKSQKPPGASKSSGDESTAGRVNRRANEVHGEFKEGIRPAADWVDERSHRVADEVRSAVNKADNSIRGDDESKPAAATPPAEPAKPAPAAPAATSPVEPVKPK